MLRSVAVVLLIVGAVTSHPGIQSRVVNGTDAKPGEFPFAISLRTVSGSHSCGGSIINKDWILTAAHCVVNKLASSVNIQYGSTKINAYSPSVRQISKIVVHEAYSPINNYANDIAIMKVAESLPIDGVNVNPVKLPGQNYEVAGNSQAVLVGWGLDKTGGSVQVNLQEVDLKVYSDADCSRLHNGKTTSNNVCAGVDEGGKGQCSGDSGGPLVAGSDKIQIGLVSWSVKPCTVAGYPGVYTKVSHYIDWINKNMN